MTGGTVAFGSGGTGSSGTYAGTGLAGGDGYRRVYSIISYPVGNPATPSGNPVNISSVSINGSTSCASGYGFYFSNNGNGTGNIGIYYIPSSNLYFQRFLGNGGTAYDSGDGTTFGSAGSGGLQGSYTWSTVPGAAGTTTAVASTVSSGVINLTWGAATDTGNSPITGYNIYIGSSTTPTKTVGVVTSSFVSGLIPGTSYTFRVAAINANGVGARGTSSASITAPSIAPPIEQVTTNIDGGWRSYSGFFTKINGAWRTVSHGWTKISGVWRQFHGPSLAIAAGGATTPFINIWSWSNSTGFVSRASTTSVTLPTNTVQSINFSKDGRYFAAGGTGSPYLDMWPLNYSGTPGTITFGTKVSNPTTLPPSSIYSTSFAPNNNFIAAAGGVGMSSGSVVGQQVVVYPFSSGTLGTQYAENYTPLVTSVKLVWATGITWKHDSSIIAISTNYYSATYPESIRAYQWNNGFGTKYSSPTGLTRQDHYSIAFSNNGNDIAAGYQGSSPYITIWPWTNISGFGTPYSSPSSAINSNVNSIRFSKSGKFLSVAHSTSPYVSVYQWTEGTGFGSRYTDPATLPTGIGYGVFFSTDDYNIAVGHATTPFISVYGWNSGFLTKFADDSTIPTGTSYEVSFS